jgi:hypothetical protein
VGAVTLVRPTRAGRSAGRLLAGIASAVLALASVGVGVAAAAPASEVTFGAPSGSSSFGKNLTFTQPVVIGSSAVKRVEILLLFPGALGPDLTEVPQTSPLGAGDHVLTFRWDPATDGHIVPNTLITATWRVTTYDGAVAEGPPIRYRYRDDGFTWQTREGPLVRIHWYEGDDAFGARALSIAETGVRNAEQLLGVIEKDPIDFYVYADQSAFYAALGPGTPENVGGEAHADIRTMFALITPSEVNQSWVKNVVPHELTHLVFNTAVDNPYHFPPRWLNEGLAVYLSVGYGSGDRADVADAADAGTLAPLTSLGGSFPNGDRFFLAYAESVSAVDYLVRQYGKPALVTLIRSYAQGLTDDEAFTAALKVDVAGFDAAWRSSLGAKPMASTGPQPAPAGPLPPDWTGSTPGSTAAPVASAIAPPASVAPGATAAPVPSPISPAPGIGGTLAVAISIGAVLGLVVVIGVIVAAARSRRPSG